MFPLSKSSSTSLYPASWLKIPTGPHCTRELSSVLQEGFSSPNAIVLNKTALTTIQLFVVVVVVVVFNTKILCISFYVFGYFFVLYIYFLFVYFYYWILTATTKYALLSSFQVYRLKDRKIMVYWRPSN